MALQITPMIMMIGGGVVTAGIAGVAVKSYVDTGADTPVVAIIEPAAMVEPQPVSVQPSVAIEVPRGKPIIDPVLPVFNVVRLERDGSVVIAGTGPPRADIEILSSGQVLAVTLSGATGDFAIVFDQALSSGDYELIIRATTADGAVVMSAEAAILHVPDEDGTALAMVSEPNQPSRVLQLDLAPVEKPVVAEAALETEPLVDAQADREQETAKLKVEPQEPVAAAVAVEEPVAPAKTQALGLTVTVKAVEIEGDKIYIAGEGKPGQAVRIYVDHRYLGEAIVGPQGAFLLETNGKISAGLHNVRTDMLQPTNLTVTARAEVQLLHQADPVEEKILVAEENRGQTVVDTRLAADKAEIVTASEMPKQQAVPLSATVAAQVAVTKAQSVEPVILRTGASVIIRRGDNLWRISRRTLGHGVRYTTIYEANKGQIRDPHWIYPGQIFRIPNAALQQQMVSTSG